MDSDSMILTKMERFLGACNISSCHNKLSVKLMILTLVMRTYAELRQGGGGKHQLREDLRHTRFKRFTSAVDNSYEKILLVFRSCVPLAYLVNYGYLN